jgi:hypothetical protein
MLGVACWQPAVGFLGRLGCVAVWLRGCCGLLVGSLFG